MPCQETAEGFLTSQNVHLTGWSEPGNWMAWCNLLHSSEASQSPNTRVPQQVKQYVSVWRPSPQVRYQDPAGRDAGVRARYFPQCARVRYIRIRRELGGAATTHHRPSP
eukprot:TRINITY_DN33338_c0_g1_i1.p3 TRINITY_DN33338_c0_g1~~TRINITY_DN33338_c0_g1_i1.p3  ORF type:complete len:109 (+),score=5.77 TRINITY_DN33338_c0_g1_i1:82-408(+)